MNNKKGQRQIAGDAVSSPSPAVKHHGLHGGDIISASAQYQLAIEDWIDLSTGLNSDSYPLPNIPASVFQHLPYLQPEFISAATSYYGSELGIPIIGSQMLIQRLPQCVARYPVLLPDIGYSEHRDSWRNDGFELHYYPAKNHRQAIASISQAIGANPKQHLVVINPNNPSGLLIAPEQLIAWAGQLAAGCYVIVDEAFMDMTPQCSVLNYHWPDNMLVLRSFGKFFGLAGIRIGFVFCQAELRAKIEQQLGLWMINGPAQYIATKAMLDTHWQQLARGNIDSAAKQTRELCAPLLVKVASLVAADKAFVVANSELGRGIPWQVEQALFSSYLLPLTLALAIQQHFAKAAILLRVIHLENQAVDAAILRIGVLGLNDREGHQRFAECIRQFCKNPVLAIEY